MEPYAVEGLAVGGRVAPNSWQYKRYKCRPSEQYEDAVTCRFSETKDGVNNALTILHLYNGVVAYINKSVAPAFFKQNEIENEIQRLSDRFGAAPRLLSSRAGVIATWGDIRLEPLQANEVASLTSGDNPNLGFLVDHLMDFKSSAKRGLPIYRLTGGKGFVWIARFAGNGNEGALRFLAADPSKMTLAGIGSSADSARAPRTRATESAPQTRGEEGKAVISTGTGFFVSADGAVVTNAHVVEGCDRAELLSGLSPARMANILARDKDNDLALLKVDAKGGSPHATIRAGVKIGEQVAVFGYPLVGLLSTNGNFTLGNVSATTGTNDDTRFLQISAPVQKGNSGGPVLDQSGQVVGVVVGKLNVLKVAEVSDDFAQNVNFAIKSTVLMNFLDANGVSFETGNLGTALAPSDLAERAKTISALIACETTSR